MVIKPVGNRAVLVTIALFLSVVAQGQVSRVIPWSDGRLDNTISISTNAYHPEPIIFIHGITASRVKWENVISNLQVMAWFQPYQYDSNSVRNAKESTGSPSEGYDTNDLHLPHISGPYQHDERNQWREIEKPYLHTFNYGRHAKIGPGTNFPAMDVVQVSRQPHDPVEWNSWQAPTKT